MIITNENMLLFRESKNYLQVVNLQVDKTIFLDNVMDYIKFLQNLMKVNFHHSVFSPLIDFFTNDLKIDIS